MKRAATMIIAILAAAALTGCASVLVKDSKLSSRTFKFSILNIVSLESTTEGLEIGEVETKKKPDAGQ